MKNITSTQVLLNFLRDSNINYMGLRGLSKHDIQLIASEETILDDSIDDWDNREISEYDENSKKLSGASAIDINEWWEKDDDDDDISHVEKYLKKAYEKAFGYSNEYHNVGEVALIGDRQAEQGYDDDEIVIYCPEVLAIVKL